MTFGLITEGTPVTLGVAILLLGLMWRIAHLVSRAETTDEALAKQLETDRKAAELRDQLNAKFLADHEARIREIERSRNPTPHRRRATD